MSQADLEIAYLRDALPVTVDMRLSDDQLRSGLDKAHERLGPGTNKNTIEGAAWLLAHDPDQRREQINHMLQIAAARRRELLQAEYRLLGAFQAEPDLDNEIRDITSTENLDDLDRAEALLGVLTARAGGTVTVTDQELTHAPGTSIEPTTDGLRLTTSDSGNGDDDDDPNDE